MEMVQFLDLETDQLVRIPAAELAPGAILARVQGIEGNVWLMPQHLKQLDHQHPPFPDDVKACIRRIYEAFAEHRTLTLEEWEDGFRRDLHPEKEIALWLHAAEVYQQSVEGHSDAAYRDDVYTCIVNCLVADKQHIWNVYRPKVMDHSQAQAVVNRFFGNV